MADCLFGGGKARGMFCYKNPKRKASSFVIIISFVLALGVPSWVLGQVSGGTVSGSVTNRSGAAMPKVKVTIQNVAAGVARMVATDTRGFYTAPDLPPDTYQMTASARGFTTEELTGITVAVGANLVVNVVMQPGNPQEVVRKVAVVQSQSSSATGGNVSSSTVRNTPLNGRDWTQLATLQAGVTGVQTGSGSGSISAQRGFGAPLSVSGARPDENNYLVDGISINDYSNGAPGSVLGANLGVDAIQQFSVLGSNYPAQYGRTSGGIINAVTRSGTNAFHGDIYEFLRNSSLDARNFFDINTPPFRRNQFGGSA
ncbi:MAG: carboxypeptidase regulatory-like domain-containing protein, partial [Terriglobia bacterium]